MGLIRTFSIEPDKYPIKKFSYMCDNRFHTELIEDLYEEKKDYGLVVVTGTGCKYYVVGGSGVGAVRKIGERRVRLPKSQKKGGQSAQRIGRIRDGDILRYLDEVVLDMRKFYLDGDGLLAVEGGIFLAGYGGKQRELVGRLDSVLRKGVVDVLVCNERDGVDEIVEKMKESMKRLEFSKEFALLEEWQEMLRKEDERCEYGEKEVRKAFRGGMLKRLFINLGALTDEKLEDVSEKAGSMGCEVVVLPFSGAMDGDVSGMGNFLGWRWIA